MTIGRRIFSATGSARTNMSVQSLECITTLLNEHWLAKSTRRLLGRLPFEGLAQSIMPLNTRENQCGSIRSLDENCLLMYISFRHEFLRETPRSSPPSRGTTVSAET